MPYAKRLLHTGGESIATDMSVFIDSSQTSYDLYIGVALLERVPISAEDLNHKMLGPLYNKATIRALGKYLDIMPVSLKTGQMHSRLVTLHSWRKHLQGVDRIKSVRRN